ncbi:hypothetical protein Pint_18020 [Pistacia integerrima]|uniref:Uncharacterized protein n=1 Tax=Pistacia integerrima TaxID=434235 RepID=A0ACC0Z0P1_9ROSI|nr:hypothetical protein Pint_18020 [Pistacia integerrima]
MIQAYKVPTANAMVEYPSIKQISSAKWHIIAIEVPQGLVFLDMSNKQDICRDINPSNIQLDGDVMQTSLLPHSPSNSRPENAMDAGGFTDLETSPVLPVCVKKDSETKKSPQRKRPLRAKDLFKKAFSWWRQNTCHMKNKKESKSNVYHHLLLISSLLASITLHTALKIQGYRVEESYEYNSSINDAVCQTENQYYFYSNWLIIMFNSIAFFLSVALLMRLFNELPLRPLLQVSVFSMVGAYLCTILDPFKPRSCSS